MSLESLPEPVLENIFQFVKQSCLLVLCWISKDFHSAATVCLYKRIIVGYSRVNIIEALPKKYTVAHKGQTLFDRLKDNPALARAVKSLTISPGAGIDASSFGVCSNLHEIQYEGFRPNPRFSNVAKVSCFMHGIPSFDTNLTELRLRFVGNSGEAGGFVRIATLMITDSVHKKLKVLALEHSGPRLYGATSCEPGENRDMSKYVGIPSWSAFFDVFVNRKSRLELTTLSLQGSVKHKKRLFKSISKAVRLQQHTTFELTITDGSHRDQSHHVHRFVTTFLISLARAARNVANLYLNYHSVCSDCENSDVIRMLRALRVNQLKNLSVLLHWPGNDTVMRLHGTIMRRQRNLISFNYFDQGSIRSKFNENEPMLDHNERLGVVDVCKQQRHYESIRMNDTPEFVRSNAGPLNIPKDGERLLLKRLRIIKHDLDGDAFWVLAKERMPHLVRYRRHGICVDMQQHMLIINGKNYSLSEWKNCVLRKRTCRLFDKYYTGGIAMSADNQGYFLGLPRESG